MYVPAAFAETDGNTLHDFIEAYSFGLLVSQVEGLPFGSHVPFLLERSTGTLLCHVARANPQWREAGGQTVLAVFSGPHAYISPSWYEAEQVVPTWNYAAVHVYGRAQVVEGEAAVLEIVQRLVKVYEQSMPSPWSFTTSGTYAERMLAQIVGLRIAIDRIEGKFKMNQNQPVERRHKVVRALQQRGGETALAVAELMHRRLEGHG